MDGHASEPGPGLTDDQPVVLTPTTPEAAEDAERILRQANLARVRGDNSMADKLLQEAMSVAPGSVAVLEAVGDDYVHRKQWRKAFEVYEMAHKAEPTNISVERKYGEMVLKVKLAVDPFMMSASDVGTMASGKAAMLLSVFLPGVGQMVLGHYVKGGVMLGGWVLGWLGFLSDPSGFKGLMTMIGMAKGATPGPLALPSLALAVGFHLWSMFDSVSTSKGLTPREKIEHPVPPVDKPF
ncbi:MAG: hypothetical protein JSS65_05045 [Armatimonadetes bacterium]|nr:hypothetical protein [Armatimonadota bacterium]